MAANKPVKKPLAAKTFAAVLERTANRFRWVIARVPFDAAKTWGKRGQLRVQGEINGFGFRGTLFPDGKGGHFLIVNKKLQTGAKTAPGLMAKFRLWPDTAPRIIEEPKELLRALGQSKRLLKFYRALSKSTQNNIALWIADVKHEEARQRRAQQFAVRLFETMEAERELPPVMRLAFRQNPRAHAQWESLSPSHRRAHLLSIFYFRDPESRALHVAKCVKAMLGREKTSKRQSIRGDSEWDQP